MVEQTPLANLDSYLVSLIIYLMWSQAKPLYQFLIKDNCPVISNGTNACFRVKRRRDFTRNYQVKGSLKHGSHLQRHRHAPIRDSKDDSTLALILKQFRCQLPPGIVPVLKSGFFAVKTHTSHLLAIVASTRPKHKNL